MQPIDIDNSHTYHAPTPEQVEHYEAIREGARVFSHLLDDHVPDGPRKTLALRNVEAAVMWANKEIACRPGDNMPRGGVVPGPTVGP